MSTLPEQNLSKEHLRFLRNTVRAGVRQGLRGERLQSYVRQKMTERFGEKFVAVNWFLIAELVVILAQLILKLIKLWGDT